MVISLICYLYIPVSSFQIVQIINIRPLIWIPLSSTPRVLVSLCGVMLLLFCMEMGFVLTISPPFLLTEILTISSCLVLFSHPMLPPYVNSISRFSAEAWNVSFPFIDIVPYWVCCRDIEWYWFPCSPAIWPWLFSCLSLALFSPPQPFIHLCPRLSFRVLRQGLLWSLSLPKWCRLWPHHWPVCLPNRLHWDELWAELRRPSTF